VAALLPLRFLKHSASSHFFVDFFLQSQSALHRVRRVIKRFRPSHAHGPAAPSLQRPVFGCSSAKLAMRHLHHAASFAIRRVVRFRIREAVTPGPRSTPRRCPPLVSRTSGQAQSRANEQSRYAP
jgi:hypothetical protein